MYALFRRVCFLCRFSSGAVPTCPSPSACLSTARRSAREVLSSVCIRTAPASANRWRRRHACWVMLRAQRPATHGRCWSAYVMRPERACLPNAAPAQLAAGGGSRWADADPRAGSGPSRRPVSRSFSFPSPVPFSALRFLRFPFRRVPFFCPPGPYVACCRGRGHGAGPAPDVRRHWLRPARSWRAGPGRSPVRAGASTARAPEEAAPASPHPRPVQPAERPAAQPPHAQKRPRTSPGRRAPGAHTAPGRPAGGNEGPRRGARCVAAGGVPARPQRTDHAAVTHTMQYHTQAPEHSSPSHTAEPRVCP